MARRRLLSGRCKYCSKGVGFARGSSFLVSRRACGHHIYPFSSPGRCRIHCQQFGHSGSQLPGAGPWRWPHKTNVGSRGGEPDLGERRVPPARGSTPQSEGGTGPNDTKTSSNGPKMRFGAILDHLEATFIHFGPFEKVKKNHFDVILVVFWPFWSFQPYWVGARRRQLSAS